MARKQVEIPEIIVTPTKLETPAKPEHDAEIVKILCVLVDTLYERDHNVATWKPIRDMLEKLK